MIDYAYYTAHFPAIVPEGAFEVVERQAVAELEKVMPPYILENVSEERKKQTVFQLCNFLYTNQDAIAGKAVTSVSNDGYSESYANRTADAVAAQIENLIYDCIGERLAGAF